ncbi:MAG: CvpA family protein [Planctomycetia bacterium]
MITLLLLGVLVATAGLFYRDGLWSALVAVANVLFAATLATAWYEWPAGLLEQSLPSVGSYADFLCIWLLFAAILAAAGEATIRVSRTRVMFPGHVDRFGAPIAGLIAGWIMVCFTALTLHLAPVTRDLIQPTPESRVVLGFAPDRTWANFMRHATRRGPFSSPGEDEANVFDKGEDFVVRHADRRKKLEGGSP